MTSTSKAPLLGLVVLVACSGAKETELSVPAPPSGATSIGGSGEADKAAGAAAPPPPASCTMEVEPNNEAHRATRFAACIDGSLKKSDVDFVEIVAPARTTKVSIAHEESGGKVSYRVYIDGMPLSAFTGDAPDYIPAVASATYRFQIQPSGAGGGARTYRLDVSFE